MELVPGIEATWSFRAGRMRISVVTGTGLLHHGGAAWTVVASYRSHGGDHGDPRPPSWYTLSWTASTSPRAPWLGGSRIGRTAVMASLEPLGDRAFLAHFDTERDAARWAAAVRALRRPGVTDVVLAYRSTAVFADPDRVDLDDLEAQL